MKKVSCPSGCTDSVGSPAPTRITCPPAPATTVVVTLCSCGSANRAADAVRTLIVDAGMSARFGFVDHNSAPVRASEISPLNSPRSGLANACVSSVRTPAGVGAGASARTGLILGVSDAGDGWGEAPAGRASEPSSTRKAMTSAMAATAMRATTGTSVHHSPLRPSEVPATDTSGQLCRRARRIVVSTVSLSRFSDRIR